MASVAPSNGKSHHANGASHVKARPMRANGKAGGNGKAPAQAKAGANGKTSDKITASQR